MADIPLSDSFEVASSFRNYSVHYTKSYMGALKDILDEGDYIIVDKKVEDLHNPLSQQLKEHSRVIRIDALEVTKSYKGVEPIIEELIVNGFKRNNRLIAIGGGITQDTTAFIASILYRGVGWIFLPTTLLAQGDSCIGSKTSINFGKFKNQLGNFYPPLSIHIDTTFLSTLHDGEVRSGVGEMAHYFYVSGPKDVAYFEGAFEQALEDQSNLMDLISKSLAIKKRYIEIDEFDRKERLVFNYGHTFGHAIESITHYEIPHGVAVSFGMDMANYVSVQKGYISKDEFLEGHNVFSTIWKGYSISGIDLELLNAAMTKDKKNQDGKLGLILTKGWGKMFKDLTENNNTFKGWMIDYMNSYHS